MRQSLRSLFILFIIEEQPSEFLKIFKSKSCRVKTKCKTVKLSLPLLCCRNVIWRLFSVVMGNFTVFSV